MKFLSPVCLSVWLFSAAPVFAQWSVGSSTSIDTGSPAIRYVRKQVLNGGKSARLDVVFLDPSQSRLRVIDDATGGSDLGSAMESEQALAGVNGGYFHPNREPLGLLIEDGRSVHPVERAKLLSGLLVVWPDRAALLRVAEYKPSPKIQQALQAGPFLVDRGKPVAGLNATRVAARTVVLSDGGKRFALAVCQSATLADAGAIFSAPGVIKEMKVARALNLDGGSSTGLWVRTPGTPVYLRELKGVRNYVAVMRR